LTWSAVASAELAWAELDWAVPGRAEPDAAGLGVPLCSAGWLPAWSAVWLAGRAPPSASACSGLVTVASPSTGGGTRLQVSPGSKPVAPYDHREAR
jgi:hypothetical protein